MAQVSNRLSVMHQMEELGTVSGGHGLDLLDDGEDANGAAPSESSSDDARPVTSASLTFVDLAGSERVSTTALEDNNQRARMYEVSSGFQSKQDLITLQAPTSLHWCTSAFSISRSSDASPNIFLAS